MSVVKFNRNFSELFNWDTDADPTTEQEYQGAVKNWTETEMNIVDTLLWQPETDYTEENIVKTPSLPLHCVLVCTTGGTSGATEPSYDNVQIGDSVTDGTVEWTVTKLAVGDFPVVSDRAKVDASNIGVNAETDNSEAWGSAIGGGAIAEDDGKLVTGGTVHAVTSVLASDIADNTDDIAENAENIAQNTTDIGIADKRIGNIEKLLQGNLYDYQTDTDSAYTKTVPSGAMPYAGIEKVGGKTIVWNQYVPAVNADNWAVVNNGKVSLSFADGECTMTATASGSGYFSYASVVKSAWQTHNLINGHKYYLSFDALSDYELAFLSNTGSPYVGISGSASSSWQTFSTIATASGDKSNLNFAVLLSSVTDTTQINVGDVVGKFRKVMFIDLTIMFGAGNEPSTTAEAEAMFPADWYAYNEGELLSAGVTEVESRSANLADFSGGAGVPSDTSSSNSTKRIFPIGKYIAGLAFNNVYSDSPVSAVTTGDGTLSFTSYNSIYGVGIPFNCKPSTTYSVSVGTITNGKTVLSWYGEDGSFLSYNSVTASQPSVSSPANAKQGVLCLYSATTGQTSTFQNIQVEENSSVTPYSPVGVIATYPIPIAIRNLEGYGWSAGTASNYIDFERKVFVKNVGSRAYASGDESDSTVITDGTNTYYALSPAVETDISQYITDDNLINVESGGTLTFPNQNGTDYQIPVPSEETYMIDLQEALS